MTNRWQISIRTKILLVLSLLVIGAVAFYLYLASKIFYEDKTLLVYELNQTNVQTFGSEMEAHLNRVIDKLKIVATLRSTTAIAEALAEESELVRVGLLRKTPEGLIQSEILGVWPKYLETYSPAAPQGPEYLDRVRTTFPIPFERVVSEAVWISNVTLPSEAGTESPPLFTVAMALLRPGSSPEVIYADLRLDRILELFSKPGIAKVYVVDSDTLPLAGKTVASSRPGKDDPLISAALRSKLRSGVQRFTERTGEEEISYLGSYYKLGIGNLVVASEIKADEAFSAARVLIRKSLLYALIVITATFLLALFFSHSLTVPIRLMVDATRRVAKGNFNDPVVVRSRDELALLANSFNLMTQDLRVSREKVEEYSRDLEKKVEQRTEQLAAQNVAIKEAQEALVRTTRLASVGEIAGRAAHEVLNPLTNINARVEKIRNQALQKNETDLKLLKEISEGWATEYSAKGAQGLLAALSGPSTAQEGKTLFEEDIENIRAIAGDVLASMTTLQSDTVFLLSESDRINKIVNGMRQLSRVSGTARNIAVHAFLDSALSTMSDLLLKNKIRIEVLYCDGQPRILADSDEMLQVVSNLLRNSLQAINEARDQNGKIGEPVWIRIATEVTPAGRVLIRVADNGPGIAEENFQRIFEPTFTTKNPDEGTGLGLSICRRFVRAYEGEVRVEKSISGVETVFLIDLPEAGEQSNGNA
ncbi:MAG: hypothetical protein A2070_06655 [Bdellovibrionales bacterium GWC1_52_8]|nr:MAG: hypothetical protein A2Z97_15160 [Bdellovibrionales bacterium GWB1_52_6]OFZ03893.1 MAG: hypothetical protein A2X97_15960 [Bdellovibrionales bacterium GWA1_52_35]OFZ39474.1 MAG: hypothetical protein A2070_06655 [Bdellovibrionales bacterium GWC1_52_8]